VVLDPCSPSAVRAFLDALRVFRLGFSWGGFESLALNGDPQFAVRERPSAFAGPVVRLSIGLEDPADLVDDLALGLAALEDHPR
jgi:cystathionine beta-lyase